MKLYIAIGVVNNWIKRRIAKGVRPNADEVWARVKRLPLSEEQAEAVFQKTL